MKFNDMNISVELSLTSKAFKAYVEEVVGIFEYEHPELSNKFKMRLISTLQAQRFNPAITQTLRQSLMRKEANIPDMIVDGIDAKEFFQLCYEAACESAGPVTADKIVSQALEEAGSSKELRRFSFKQWL